MPSVGPGSMRRGESSEETESTTTSRRGSEDSDSGVNLSERDVLHQTHPGRPDTTGESYPPAQLCHCIITATKQRKIIEDNQ